MNNCLVFIAVVVFESGDYMMSSLTEFHSYLTQPILLFP